jgi:hypothetical protein
MTTSPQLNFNVDLTPHPSPEREGLILFIYCNIAPSLLGEGVGDEVI